LSIGRVGHPARPICFCFWEVAPAQADIFPRLRHALLRWCELADSVIKQLP